MPANQIGDIHTLMNEGSTVIGLSYSLENQVNNQILHASDITQIRIGFMVQVMDLALMKHGIPSHG